MKYGRWRSYLDLDYRFPTIYLRAPAAGRCWKSTMAKPARFGYIYIYYNIIIIIMYIYFFPKVSRFEILMKFFFGNLWDAQSSTAQRKPACPADAGCWLKSKGARRRSMRSLQSIARKSRAARCCGRIGQEFATWVFIN